MSEPLNDARRSFMAGQRRLYGHEADSPRLEAAFVSGWIACCNDFRNRANNLLPVGQPFSHTVAAPEEDSANLVRGEPFVSTLPQHNWAYDQTGGYCTECKCTYQQVKDNIVAPLCIGEPLVNPRRGTKVDVSAIEGADFLRKSICESFLFSPTAQRAVETLIAAALANVTLATPGHRA